MTSIPHELSSLGNLKELLLNENRLPEPPLSVLRAMTSLKTIDLSYQGRGEDPVFTIPSPLLPILHPGLVELDLRQSHKSGAPIEWDTVSLFHLGRAMVEVADRTPIPALLFKLEGDLSPRPFQ